jgi:signal transduction histidine kinase/HPt (histidine-containing phosphotransfer) domain-containing protein
MQELLQRILRLGVSPQDDEEAVRRFKISNALYLISVLVATGTTVGPYLAGAPKVAMVGTLMFPTVLLCFFLNSRRAVRASRFLLLTALNAVIVGMAAVVGAEVLAATVFVVLPIPFFLFDRSELRHLAGCVGMVATTAVLLHLPGLLDEPGTRRDPILLLFRAVSFVGLLSLLTADFFLRRKLAIDLQAARVRAEESGHAKGMFLANMSHEIRTPMGAILGYADLLSDALATDEQKENALEAVRRNGAHLMELLNKILDVAKIEAGELLVELGPVSPTRIIWDVVAGLRTQSLDQRVALEIDLPERMPRTLQSDKLRMRQILLNLVGNALKFTEQGSVTVSAALEPGYLAIHVADTGLGIREAELLTVFENFAQAESDSARQAGGTGLGLAISRDLTALLGGRLTVESEIGLGSKFTVAFPLTSEEALDLVAPDTSLPGDTAPHDLPGGLGPVRVLLAEDFDDAAALVEFHLARQGCDVTTVGDGEAALLAVESAAPPFDVVLMDNQMPVMDGLVAIGRLRSRGNSIPVVSLTANAMSGDRARCMAAGADGYLTKPVDLPRLFAEIKRLVPRASTSTAPADPGSSPWSFEDLRDGYRERLPARMEKLRQAWERRDLATLVELAHKIAGSAGSYGFHGLGEAARTLEVRLRAVDEDAQLDLAAELGALGSAVNECVGRADEERQAPAANPR